MKTRVVSIVTLLAVAVAACSSPTRGAAAPGTTSPTGEVVGVVHVVGGPRPLPPTSVTSQVASPLTIRPFGSSRPRQVPTDAAGRFHVRVPPGRYVIAVLGWDAAQVVVPPGRTVRVKPIFDYAY